MGEYKCEKIEIIRYRQFNGDLTKFPEYRLADCIGLFKIEEKRLNAKTGELIGNVCVFELGFCGEKSNQYYWFYNLYDDREKYIVDNHGDGKWEVFDTDDATEIYRKSTLCELIYIYDRSLPKIDFDIVGSDE